MNPAAPSPTPESRRPPTLRSPRALLATSLAVVVALCLLVAVLRLEAARDQGPATSSPVESLQVLVVKAPAEFQVGKAAPVQVRITNVGAVPVPRDSSEIASVGSYFTSDPTADVALNNPQPLGQTLAPGESMEVTLPCIAWQNRGPMYLVIRVFANRKNGDRWEGGWISAPSSWRVRIR